MQLIKLGDIFALKYKIAVSNIDLEAMLRNRIDNLVGVINKSHNILRACAEANPDKAKTDDEKLAMEGHQFCQELVSTIDYLKANKNKLSLTDLQQALGELKELIERNMLVKGAVQLPHVSSLIFHMIPIRTKSERKLRDELPNKARTGISRIMSIVMDMLKDITQIQTGQEPFGFEEGRFVPQRAPISENDIVDFIRLYGSRYGIEDRDDWALIVKDDQELKEKLTTIINALNRGRTPIDGAAVRHEVIQALKRHNERQKNNAQIFESNELLPQNDLTTDASKINKLIRKYTNANI